MKKRVRCVLSVIFAAVCAFPAVPVWGYAAGDIQSRCYSVGMDYILGIEPGYSGRNIF